jgi:hypothetical protein
MTRLPRIVRITDELALQRQRTKSTIQSWRGLRRGNVFVNPRALVGGDPDFRICCSAVAQERNDAQHTKNYSDKFQTRFQKIHAEPAFVPRSRDYRVQANDERGKTRALAHRKSSALSPLPSMMLLSVPIGIGLFPCTATITCRPFKWRHF